VNSTTVRSTYPHQHIHHKANARGSGHAPVGEEFLERVTTGCASYCIRDWRACLGRYGQLGFNGPGTAPPGGIDGFAREHLTGALGGAGGTLKEVAIRTLAAWLGVS
jgi:hypothetical protein